MKSMVSYEKVCGESLSPQSGILEKGALKQWEKRDIGLETNWWTMMEIGLKSI